jgi:hypothetical protein
MSPPARRCVAETLRRAALLAVCAALLAIAGMRGAALAAASGAPAERLTALGERRWYAWAQRHPRMDAAFAAAAARLPAGARVVWVVPPGVQPPWVEIMAFYHLPDLWTVAVRRRGTPAAADTDGATWRVDVYADGRVLVRPRG